MGYSPWGCKELDTTEELHLLGISTSKTKVLEPHPCMSDRWQVGRTWQSLLLGEKEAIIYREY